MYFLIQNHSHQYQLSFHILNYAYHISNTLKSFKFATVLG